MSILDDLIRVSAELADVDTKREQVRECRDALVVRALADGAKWADIETLGFPGLSRGNINKIVARARAQQ